MNMQALALAFLAAIALGGVAWVFLYPVLSGEKKAERRRLSVARSEPVARQAEKSQRSRREQVEGSLKEVEARRQKERKVALSTRLMQAGLDWSPQKFMIISGVLGAFAFGITMLMTLRSGGDMSVTASVIVDDSSGRFLELGIGKSIVVDLRRDISDVTVANPAVANATTRSQQQIYVTGNSAGETSIVVSGPSGKLATYQVAIAGPRSLSSGLLAAVGLAFAAGFGLPRWMLGYLKKRREKSLSARASRCRRRHRPRHQGRSAAV